MSPKLLALFGGMTLLFGCVLGFFLGYWISDARAQKQMITYPSSEGTPADVLEVEGTQTCLPHTDVTDSGPRACALGLVSHGTYYGIDVSGLTPQDVKLFMEGIPVRVRGVFTSREALSGDHWRTYTMQGIIRVTSLQSI